MPKVPSSIILNLFILFSSSSFPSFFFPLFFVFFIFFANGRAAWFALSAVGASRGQRTVVLCELAVVGVHVRPVDFAGLARHVGQQLHWAFVRRSQRMKPFFQANFVLWLDEKHDPEKKGDKFKMRPCLWSPSRTVEEKFKPFYLICEHNTATFFSTKKDALFALEGRQFRIDFFNVIHQNEFRLRTRRFVMQFQSVGIEAGVSGLPGRSKRTAQFLDVPVKDAVGICWVCAKEKKIMHILRKREQQENVRASSGNETRNVRNEKTRQLTRDREK